MTEPHLQAHGMELLSVALVYVYVKVKFVFYMQYLLVSSN